MSEVEDRVLAARTAAAGARQSIKTLARVAKSALADVAALESELGELERSIDELETREAERGESHAAEEHLERGSRAA